MSSSGLTDDQRGTLLVAAQVCATFSLMGSLFIVACYSRYPHLRKLSFTLVLWLAVTDIGSDVSYFMGNPEDNKAACVVQGALQQFFQMAQILWTVAIACVLYEVTVNLRMYHPHDQKSLMLRFHLYVWGAAFVSMILPFTTGSYGSAGSWCWIEITPRSESNVDVGTMWRYLVLYCPLWAAIIFNIVVYVRIVKVVRRFSASIGGNGSEGSTIGPSAEQQMRMTKFVKRLMWYPAILIVSWTFATINRIQNAVQPEAPVFSLFLLHKCLVALQGFLNAVVYGSTDTVRAAVVQDPSLEPCFKTQEGGGAGWALESAGMGEGGMDPEDEDGEASAVGIGMRSLR